MSYPIGQVPEGWTRGEPLVRYGSGPRYALMPRAVSEAVATTPVVHAVVAVEFDCLADRNAWLEWWNAPC